MVSVRRTFSPSRESDRPRVATSEVLPTPPAIEKMARMGVRVSFWRTGAGSACSGPGCSKIPLRAYQRAATRSRECWRVSPTEDCGGGAGAGGTWGADA